MTRSNWIAGAAIVLVVLGLALTVDPLGFFEDGDDESDGPENAGTELTSDGTGLQGRGTAELPNQDPKTWEGDPVGVLYLELGSAALKGIVTTDDKPLRFARVQPVLPPPNDGVAVRTRKDGTWEIRGLPAGQFDVRGSHTGYIGRTVVSPAVKGKETAQVEPIDLMPRAPRTDAIAVKVIDSFGHPIQGAKVLASTMPWDLHLAMGPDVAGVRDVQHKSGVTDERGRARLGPMMPEDYNVVAHAKGYVNAAVNNVVVSAGRERNVTIRLAESVAIHGQVVDGEGNGIPDAVVMGMAQPSFHSSLTAHSDANGNFVLDGLRKGRYMVIGYEEKGGQVMTTGQAPSRGVKIKLEGTGRVEGRLVWEDGTAVSNGQVRPFQSGPFQYVYSQVHRVKTDGTFEVNLPKGKWNFRAQADSGQMSDGNIVTVNVGETSEITIKLPKTGIVRGVVMDQQGNHIEGAEVFVMQGGMPGGPSREQYARSDADGVFEVPGLPLEPVVLHVTHPIYADDKINATPQGPSDVKSISVKLSAGASVGGRVTDSEGNGVGGEQVNLVVNWFSARSTHTDGEGRYHFPAVAAGTYTMTTGPYEQGAGGLRRGGVNVGAEGHVEINFENPAAKGQLTGEVTQGGAAVANAEVRVQDARGPEYAVTVRTDDTGRFLVEGLQYGRVSVYATTPAGLSGTKRGDVAQGAASSHLVIDIGSATLRVRAVDQEGNPVPGCWCNTEVADAEDGGWSRVKDNGNTDSEGIYQTKGLQAGTYIVRINRVEFAQYTSAPFTIAAGEVKNLGDVTMTRGTLLSGQVKNDAGEPMEKATVSLKDMQGRPVFLFSMATTGSDGRYSLHGIEPGRYVVTIEAKSHGPFEKEIDIGASGATVDGVLTRGGRVTVTVEDESGHPLAGARLRLYDGRGKLVTRTISMANFDSGKRTTGGDGTASLDDLAGGTYKVRCELSGYSPLGSEPTVFVKPGETATTRIVLQATQ